MDNKDKAVRVFEYNALKQIEQAVYFFIHGLFLLFIYFPCESSKTILLCISQRKVCILMKHMGAGQDLYQLKCEFGASSLIFFNQEMDFIVALGQDGDIKLIKEHHNQIIRPRKHHEFINFYHTGLFPFGTTIDL